MNTTERRHVGDVNRRLRIVVRKYCQLRFVHRQYWYNEANRRRYRYSAVVWSTRSNAGATVMALQRWLLVADDCR